MCILVCRYVLRTVDCGVWDGSFIEDVILIIDAMTNGRISATGNHYNF